MSTVFPVRIVERICQTWWKGWEWKILLLSSRMGVSVRLAMANLNGQTKMGQFHSTFFNFGRGANVCADSFRSYFLEYEPDKWLEEGGGALQYFSDDEKTYSLTMLQNGKYGVLLLYSCYDRASKKTLADLISIGDKEMLRIIEDIGDDEFFPVGAFLKPEIAWLAVEDFFNDPCQRSTRIEWVATCQIEWPE